MRVEISGLFFLCLLSLCLSANAQKRSSIQIHTGGFYLFGYRSLPSHHFHLFDFKGSKGAQANQEYIFAMQGIKHQ